MVAWRLSFLIARRFGSSTRIPPASDAKSRLRQQYEDSQLLSQQPPGGQASILATANEAAYSADPTVLVAERRILDAVRRGSLNGLAGAGQPRRRDAHRDAARHLGAGGAAAADLAGVLAANQLKPLSVELRLDVEAQRRAVLATLAATPRDARRESPALRAQAATLAVLVRRQHGACIADSLVYGTGAGSLQCAPFDLDAAIDAGECR